MRRVVRTAGVGCERDSHQWRCFPAVVVAIERFWQPTAVRRDTKQARTEWNGHRTAAVF